jgi:hypothetical protein
VVGRKSPRFGAGFFTFCGTDLRELDYLVYGGSSEAEICCAKNSSF